jgi:hypothetical protein
MSKYQFDRLSPDTFERMVQALLETNRRGFGTLTQFGAGPDGAREATWLQPSEHPTFVPPRGQPASVSNSVFQAKFHNIGLRGWKGRERQFSTTCALS